MTTKYLKDKLKVKVLMEIADKKQAVVEHSSGKTELVRLADLYDSPPLSARELELESVQSKVEKAKQELEDIKDKIIQSKSDLKFERKIKVGVERIARYLEEDDLSHVVNFLSGKYRWAARPSASYSVYEPMPLSKFTCDNEVRLFSVFGKENGQLSIKANQYSDGSGGYTEYAFFETEEEALKYGVTTFIKSMLENNVGYGSANMVASTIKKIVEGPWSKVLTAGEKELILSKHEELVVQANLDIEAERKKFEENMAKRMAAWKID